MAREVYTYSDIARLAESKAFQEIKKHPIITVSADLRRGLKGRLDLDRVNGLFRADESVHVTDFHTLLSRIDDDWRADQHQFQQLVIMSEELRRRLMAAGDDPRLQSWLTGCMRNLHRMQSAITLLEEAEVKPEDLRLSTDRNLLLLADLWDLLLEREPSIREHRAKMARMTDRAAWDPVLRTAFRMSDVSAVRTLVFHDFYFITPLQERVMQLLERAGFHLIYLIQYDKNHPFVHEIWERTYAPENGYPEKTNWHGDADERQNPWAEIFEGKQVTLPNSVQIREYASMMEFVDDVPNIRQGGYTLYSANFTAANAVLREYYPEEFGERKILSYPIGQFISTLNQMWDEQLQQITLTEDQLIDCFASGWLTYNGIAARQYMQDLVNLLPFFTNCRTGEEWEARIRLLQQIQDEAVGPFQAKTTDPNPAIARWQEAIGNPLANIGSFSVPKDHLDVILGMIRQLIGFAHELYQNNQTIAIADYIAKLDTILRAHEISNELYTEERELVGEIFENLGKPSDVTIRCYPADISSALNLFLYGKLSEGEIQARRIGLVHPLYYIETSPIVHRSKVHICLCDVDNLPGKNKEYIWPLTESAVREIQGRTRNPLLKNLIHVMAMASIGNRYFFYNALRSKNVQLSWVSRQDEKLLAPSAYVKLAVEAAGLTVIPPRQREITFQKVAEAPYTESFALPYRKDRMPTETIKEARMDYAVCPMKYVLSYILERYPTYESTFQQTYSIPSIIAAIYRLMAEDGMSLEEVYRNVIALFPHVRKVEKRQVYDYTGKGRSKQDTDTSGRTQNGNWYTTEERLNIHFPEPTLLQRAMEAYGILYTPDGRDGLNFFGDVVLPKKKQITVQQFCAFCPQTYNCRNALFALDQERLYD